MPQGSGVAEVKAVAGRSQAGARAEAAGEAQAELGSPS